MKMEGRHGDRNCTFNVSDIVYTCTFPTEGIILWIFTYFFIVVIEIIMVTSKISKKMWKLMNFKACSEYLHGIILTIMVYSNGLWFFSLINWLTAFAGSSVLQNICDWLFYAFFFA